MTELGSKPYQPIAITPGHEEVQTEENALTPASTAPRRFSLQVVRPGRMADVIRHGSPLKFLNVHN